MCNQGCKFRRERFCGKPSWQGNGTSANPFSCDGREAMSFIQQILVCLQNTGGDTQAAATAPWAFINGNKWHKQRHGMRKA